MQLLNRTTAALLTGTRFLQQNLPYFSSNQTYSTMTSSSRAPVVAVCHGGGPMPLLDDPTHKGLVNSMKTRIPEILGLDTPSAPRAIVLVTAHWLNEHPTISNGKKHDLYFDYHGFPPETYKFKYDAPGSPEVAGEVYELLQKAGMNPQTDGQRGWDHGVFVPLLLINPAANIPIIQLSVLSSASPAQHYAMGRALAPLRDSGVAIVGSGMASFHNLRLIFSGITKDKSFQRRNREFTEKLTQTVGLESSQERGKAFNGWREWVGAVEAHPQGGEDHFLPLIVCAGAAGDGKSEAFSDEVFETKQYTYYWK